MVQQYLTWKEGYPDEMQKLLLRFSNKEYWRKFSFVLLDFYSQVPPSLQNPFPVTVVRDEKMLTYHSCITGSVFQ